MRGICKSLGVAPFGYALSALTSDLIDVVAMTTEALRVSMHAVEHGLGELEAARDEADTQRGVAKATADLDAYRADKRFAFPAACCTRINARLSRPVGDTLAGGSTRRPKVCVPKAS